MSNTDGFIEEVTEEVRREKLYGYLRRYGWIAVALVILVVGGAAWSEYRNAQREAAAQAAGDDLLNALNIVDDAERTETISQLSVDGSGAAVAELLKASALQEADDVAGAAAILNGLASNEDVPQMYRDLAEFKAAILPSDDSADRLANLERLAEPGQPFRLLALEQIAYAQLDQGETDAAVTTLQRIVEDAAVGRGLRERAQTLMVALGEPIPEPQTE